MSIFNMRKTERRREDKRDVLEENMAIDIEPYAPNQGLGPIPYLEPFVMTNLKDNIEEHLTDFLERTNPDRHNTSYVDNIIEQAVQQGMQDLATQRTAHIKTIERIITSIWRGDEVYYQKLLEDYEREYEMREKELKRLKAIYQKDTALEDSAV